MEAQPTFAQLYLHIDRLGPGGISHNREGFSIDANEINAEANLRNLYVSYKAFPTLEKLVTSIQYSKTEP